MTNHLPHSKNRKGFYHRIGTENLGFLDFRHHQFISHLTSIEPLVFHPKSITPVGLLSILQQIKAQTVRLDLLKCVTSLMVFEAKVFFFIWLQQIMVE